MAFTGFPDATFEWFDGLEHDNSKRYFERTRATYDEHVRGALEAFFIELQAEVGGTLKLFRQQRDTRFARDKSPYKTTTYGVLGGWPGSEAGFYAQLSAVGLFAGGGYHWLAADQLARFRAAVLDDAAGPTLERLVADAEGAGWAVSGEALKTAPRGVARDHPRVRLLRHKGLFGGQQLEPAEDGIGRDAALAHARRAWALATPLVGWLDEHVGASAIPPEQRR